MPSASHPVLARRVTVVALCLASIAGLTRLSVWWNDGAIVLAEDRIHDGQADVWDTQPDADESVVAIDTNFDGRPDERLRYRNGDLVSLEADSDFDNRIDIVEEFDPATHEVVRSLIDVDEDGRADLLVYSHDGQPVFEKWADQVAPATAQVWTMGTPATAGALTSSGHPVFDDGALLPLADPFIGDSTVRTTCPWRPSQRDSLLSTSGGLPLPATVISVVHSSVSVPESPFDPDFPLATAPTPPRGPPIFTPITAALF